MPPVDAPIRNVAFDPSSPVSGWNAEVIETVMDRGSLSDWRILATEIRARPWGAVARTVESIAAWDEHYGVDALMRHVVADARDRFDRAARLRYARRLRDRRTAAGLTLRELATMAGTSETRLSAYENAAVAPTTTVLGRIEAVLDALD